MYNKPELSPKQVVPARLYKATLKYVNALRQKEGLTELKALPAALPGIEGCPVGLALHELCAPYDADMLAERESVSWMDEEDLAGVRVTTFNGKTRIRYRDITTLDMRTVVTPKYVTQFLDTFDKKARKAFK